MRKFFEIILFISGILLSLVTAGCSEQGDKGSAPAYIQRLDSVLAKAPEFDRSKLLRIEEIRHRLQKVTNESDRYVLSSMLFEEYLTENSDSAMKYIDRCIDLAKSLGNKKWEAQSVILKSEYLTSTGMLVGAKEIMSTLDPSQLPRDVLPEYYGQMVYLYSHLGNYVGGEENEYYVMERAYKDSIMATIDESHPQYLWFKGWDVLGTDQPVEPTVKALEKRLAASRLDTHQDAKNAYILAQLYKQKGDKENYMKNLAMSAEADIRIANKREMSSFEDLSKALFDGGKGDIEHAYDYISYCLDKAIGYPNRVRAYLLSEEMAKITEAYNHRIKEQQRRTNVYLVLMCVLAGIFLVSLIYNILFNLKLHKQQKNLDETNKSLNRNIADLNETHEKLNEANSQLQQVVAELKEKNEDLNEANYVKEEYICNVFSICANYINQMSELKKNIHIKVLGKKYKEIEKETQDFDMKDDYKEFFKSFDTVFLHIYPDFVHDFNELLEPDKRIYPKEGELLNTELRIYALIRLGITDSVRIAEFLHISAQTVYNNRFKVRNRAVIDKKEFAEAVAKLGRAKRV